MSAALQPALTTRNRSSVAARDHQVVEDAAARVGEEAVALLAEARPSTSTGTSDSSAAIGIVAEPAAAGPCARRRTGAAELAAVPVLGQDAGGVLDRHVVAGEGHHAGAEFEVQRVQRRALEFAGGRCDVGHGETFKGVETTPLYAGGGALAVRFT